MYFYVVDDDARLVGVLPTRRLLTAPEASTLDSVMVRSLVSLPSGSTVREAIDLLSRHRLLALPVVDRDGRLEGVVDLSMFTGDLADLGERQAAHDVFQMIGVHLSRSVTPWRGFGDRFPWLLCNVAGGLIAAVLAAYYEPLLESAIVLALFIPVVLALAESVSVQSVGLTLQALHGARADLRFLASALRREFLTAVLLGAGCGALVGAIAGAWRGQWPVAAAIAATILLAMITACVLGVVLPVVLHRINRDPKVAAGPIVLALADTATLLVYFNLAGFLLSR